MEGIPVDMLRLYQAAAQTCPGLPWTVLAAIGKIESNHGRSTLPGVHSGENYAGAGGPMQFLSGTWAAYGVDGDGDGIADRYNPADAVYGAANYLCTSGAGQPGRLRQAIFAYNHADWYVNEVLAQAAILCVSRSSLNELPPGVQQVPALGLEMSLPPRAKRTGRITGPLHSVGNGLVTAAKDWCDKRDKVHTSRPLHDSQESTPCTWRDAVMNALAGRTRE